MKTAKYSKALTIALHPDAFELIKQITDTEQISIAEWTRAAIDTALAKHQREEEVKNDN